MTKLNGEVVAEGELRLANGETLRAIAKSMDLRYQTLQYHRSRAGLALIRPPRKCGSDHASWRGGEFRDRFGYKMVLAPERGKASKYAPEHILIAERHMGRLLHANEIVHHVDLDKTNNDLKNLHVCTKRRHGELHSQLECLAATMLREGLIVWDGESYRRR